MTRQEMFDLSVRGLRSQGFERAAVITRAADGTVNGNTCQYLTPEGRRCAWGWIDRTLTNEPGRVEMLHDAGIGLAASLNEHDVCWASSLQDVHDCSCSPENMESRLRVFATRHALTFPEN